MDLYAFLAPYYDTLFPVGDAQRDFLLRYLQASGIARVLDAGCGTGRHLEIFAANGFEVAGIEPSASMAALARERLEPRGAEHEIAVASLAEAPDHLNGPYDAAVCLGNTLAHLLPAEQLAAGLAALARLLRPGGRLITQTVNFDAVLARGEWSFPERSIEHPEHGSLVFKRSYRFESAPERLGFELELSGRGLALSETLSLKPYTRVEQISALSQAGFELEAEWGDWDARGASSGAPALILSSRRVSS